jgi:hypothetical protein
MLMGQKLCLKSIQYDRLDQGYVPLLGSIIGLERMYLLDSLSCVQHDQMLRDMFLDAIVTNHSATLRHLMLPAYCASVNCRRAYEVASRFGPVSPRKRFDSVSRASFQRLAVAVIFGRSCDSKSVIAAWIRASWSMLWAFEIWTLVG